MAIVIHIIKGKRYAYDHFRVGNRIKTKYLYPVGKGGAKRVTEYKPGEGKRFKQHSFFNSSINFKCSLSIPHLASSPGANGQSVSTQ